MTVLLRQHLAGGGVHQHAIGIGITETVRSHIGRLDQGLRIQSNGDVLGICHILFTGDLGRQLGGSGAGRGSEDRQSPLHPQR